MDYIKKLLTFLIVKLFKYLLKLLINIITIKEKLNILLNISILYYSCFKRITVAEIA